ncbi:hypothetical protein [Streptomyces sp. NPDC053048]|uniref:hypothetical protein n=1 Tax=Streptomyces sp. NPDC053048 TaxID=3365694 RepID=UPI0037CEDF76
MTVAALATGVTAVAAAPAQAADYLQVYGDPVLIPPGEFRLAEVDCPLGRVPTGGGYQTQGGQDIVVLDSYAVDRGWNAAGKNTGATEQSLMAFVICAVGES